MDKREFEVSFTDSELQRLQKAMKKAGLTFEEFMVQAVKEKLERMKKGRRLRSMTQAKIDYCERIP